jgi:L-arabinose isomerase
MPYMFFRPVSGVEECVRRWLEEGGTHHEVVVFGDCRRRVEMLCAMLDIGCCFL